MRTKQQLVAAIVAVGFCLLTACQSSSGPAKSRTTGIPPRHRVPSKSAPVTEGKPGRDITQIDEIELERRVRAHASFAAGVVQQLNENSDQALSYFERAAMEDPSNEGLTLDVARRRLQRKEFEQAVALLKKAASMPQASGSVHSYLGLTLSQLDRRPEAIEAYREALRRMPGNLASAGMLAQLLTEGDKVEEAFAVLKAVAGQSSEDPRFWLDLSDLFQQQGTRQPARAEECKKMVSELLDRALKTDSKDPRVIRRLADRLYETGRMAESESLYKRVREVVPTDSFSAARLAELYLRSGRPKEAKEQLQALQRESPTDPLPVYYLAMVAVDERQLDRAIELFGRSILLGPDFEPAYVDLASALLGVDRATEALEVLEKRALRFKSSFRAAFLSGLAAARLEKADEALQHFVEAEARARADQPAILDHRFFFQVGATLERLGNADKAAEYLQKSLETKPDFPEALNHLGYMWAERGVNLDRAHDMIRKAVEAEPENEAYLDSLGWVLFKLGRHSEALIWLEKSAKLLEKPDPTIHDHLGDVYAALGRWKEAAEQYQKSLVIEKNVAVQKKLDAIPKGAIP